jgi:hypothetical protein
MSSWHPTDLVTDQDLLDYERSLPLIFGENEQWAAQRTKALEDWLFPTLKGQGLEPQRLRTRFVPSEAYSHIASAYADVTTAASDIAADDLNLATIFATAASDRLYVASTEPFRGLFVRIHDEVSSATSALTVKYWNGRWKALAIADGTAAVSGKTLRLGHQARQRVRPPVLGATLGLGHPDGRQGGADRHDSPIGAVRAGHVADAGHDFPGGACGTRRPMA